MLLRCPSLIFSALGHPYCNEGEDFLCLGNVWKQNVIFVKTLFLEHNTGPRDPRWRYLVSCGVLQGDVLIHILTSEDFLWGIRGWKHMKTLNCTAISAYFKKSKTYFFVGQYARVYNPISFFLLAVSHWKIVSLLLFLGQPKVFTFSFSNNSKHETQSGIVSLYSMIFIEF